MTKSPLNVQVVLLAGGLGTRLWPLSRKHLPKQFLPLALGGKTLLQAAFERAVKLAGLEERVWVCANVRHGDLVRQQLPSLHADHLLLEPIGRNTAASLGWAALCIQDQDPRCVMVSLPADHLFREERLWLQAAWSAVQLAAQFDRLVLLGVQPQSASPHYGYLQIARPLLFQQTVFYEINRFLEKPAPTEAEKLLMEGKVLWNTGVVVAKVAVFLSAFERHLPDAFEILRQIRATPTEAEEKFAELPVLSVDVGVLEKERPLFAVHGNFERIDIGNLNSLRDLLSADENANRGWGLYLTRNASQNLAITDEGMIGLIGVEGLAVVRWGDVVVVCPQDRLDEIKAFQAHLSEKGWEDYL